MRIHINLSDILRSLLLEANPELADEDIERLVNKYWPVINKTFALCKE